MAREVIADIDQLQSALDLYLRSVKTGPESLEDLRANLMRKFDEDDKRRGAPYLAPTREVSEEYKIEYKEHVEFLGDEEPFDSSVLDLLADEEEGIDIDEELDMDELDDSSDDLDTGVIEIEDDFTDDGIIYESEDEDSESEDLPDDGIVQEDEVDDYVEDESGEIDDYVEDESEEIDDFPDDGVIPVEDELPDDGIEPVDEEELSDDSGELDDDFPDDGIEPVEDDLPDDGIEPVDDDTSVIEQQGIAEVESESLSIGDPGESVLKQGKPKKKVVRRVVRKKKREDVSDGFDFDVNRKPTAKQRSVAKPKISSPEIQEDLNNPKSVVDYVKANPNCPLKEVLEYYPKKEVQKHVKTGKIYLKGGRLSV